MKFENTLTMNWRNALRGLRNPMNSWASSDSDGGLCSIYGDEFYDVTDAWVQDKYSDVEENTPAYYDACDEIDEWLCKNAIIQMDGDNTVMEWFAIGPKDMKLAQRMIAAGSPNDKFLRQIFVSVDITAPTFFWSEMDTYKVSTVANSTSTMHKLASTPITPDKITLDSISPFVEEQLIPYLEQLRQKYNETKEEKYWRELIQLLPRGWEQKRTWTANYGVLRNIIHWRQTHRLKEWREDFISWCKTLPYAEEFLFYCNEPGVNG